MYVSFESLPDYARIWIYQGSRKFTSAETELIERESRSFCEQWEAHGSPLKTSFKLEYGHFLILAVDEGVGTASGCSIDGSVRMLKALQAQSGIDFLDRSKVALLVDGAITLVPVSGLKQAVANGILGIGTSTFDPQIGTKGSLETGWRVLAGQSWLARYLPKTPVV